MAVPLNLSQNFLQIGDVLINKTQISSIHREIQHHSGAPDTCEPVKSWMVKMQNGDNLEFNSTCGTFQSANDFFFGVDQLSRSKKKGITGN